VWVADRGFASVANRAYLTRGGGHYIHAEKLRHTNTEATAALARAGRYRTVADNLRVKEVSVAPGGDGDGDGDDGARTQRFVICHNPEQGDRDAAVRANLVEHLQQLIDGSDAGLRGAATSWSAASRPSRGCAATCAAPPRGCCASTRPRSNERRTWTASGCCAPPTSPSPSPPTISPPPTKQLLAVEWGWRDFKGALGLRPVFHHREDRIRAHIHLCGLALLLLRVIENATGDTWRNLRHELDRMHLVTLATNAGRVAQRSATTPGRQTVLRALDLPEPPRFFDFTLPDSR
jgi:hypothetical protein